ncbi:Rv3235 family protein [Nocardioides sp. MAHUQ-72]|uniref:Rv3235 family protein n=1 Tax=unclassified Nocardioides TaxID=2615069 RepID=UPI0036169514
MTPSRENVVPLRVPVPVDSIQGTLALDLQPRHDPPVPGRAPCRVAGDVIPIDQAVRRQVEEWARRYAQAAVEIVGGDRPVSQLLRWSSRDVYLDLHRRALLVARAGQHLPGQGRVQPVRPQVRGVHTCFLSRRAVEVSVHVRYGQRSRALAARFELRSGRWQCTALEFA